MTVFVDSLKRLYQNQKVSLEKIQDLLKDNKINTEEYEYIIKE